MAKSHYTYSVIEPGLCLQINFHSWSFDFAEIWKITGFSSLHAVGLRVSFKQLGVLQYLHLLDALLSKW